MIRMDIPLLRFFPSLPRTRGDDPPDVTSQMQVTVFAPHARG